jgi:hypothetical protein
LIDNNDTIVIEAKLKSGRLLPGQRFEQFVWSHLIEANLQAEEQVGQIPTVVGDWNLRDLFFKRCDMSGPKRIGFAEVPSYVRLHCS